LPELGSRNALIGASAFALLVVVLSILGAQPLELLFGVAMIVLPVIFLYLIIRRAVRGASGTPAIVASKTSSHAPGDTGRALRAR
jgi:purine-cytosine permease-like protein